MTISAWPPLLRQIRYFTSLDNHTIDRLLDATIPSSETIIELAYLGGAAAEVGAGDTAFGDRSAPVVLTLLANWTTPSDDAANISWARGIFERFRLAMKPGVYVNSERRRAIPCA
jgi:hypothetical protein